MTGGSCQRTIEGYIGASLNDLKKDRKTFQLPRQLCWTIDRGGGGTGAGPFPTKEGSLIITGTSPTVGGCRGSAWCLQGERTSKAMNSTRTRGGSCRGELPGGRQVHLSLTLPERGRRGCRSAIDRQIHGLLTGWCRRGRSGGDSRDRSSWTFFECGSGVVTAVTAMGGRVRATGWDWLVVSAPGAGGILTSVSRASMMKRTNGARRVCGGASLMGASVSPAVSAVGGSGCGEGKFNLAFLREADDACGEGGNVLGVDSDNHRSGLLGAPRISARVKVPG